MHIKVTRKKMAIVILLVIIVPIVYNKISGKIAGIIQSRLNAIPKEVVVDNPKKENAFITAEATGRVEAKYSVDVIARVPGFLIKKYFKEGRLCKKRTGLYSK